MYTKEELRALGRVYALLASVQPLTDAEIESVCFTPMESLPAAIKRREKKLSPEKHEAIARLMEGVSPEAGGRVSEPDTGVFWLGFYAQQKPGRPALYADGMKQRSVGLSTAMWDKLATRAEAENKSVSEVIRDAVNKYLAE